MTPVLPAETLPLLGLVFALGVKHGFDADHLATIDALTRSSHRSRRAAGALFSLGHGLVVVAVAVVVQGFAGSAAVPDWLDGFGSWTSIAVLTLLGLSTWFSAWRTPHGQIVAPRGLRSRLVRYLPGTAHPLAALAVGALFAFSFDTISQATLMALSAAEHGTRWTALWLGLSFMLGMMLVDGANGRFVAWLLERSDARAAAASRVMAYAVGAVSLAIAAIGLIRQLRPDMDAVFDAWGWAISVGVILAMLIAVAYAFKVAARPASLTMTASA